MQRERMGDSAALIVPAGSWLPWELWEQRTKPDFLAIPLTLSPGPTLLRLSPAPQLPTDPLVLAQPHPIPPSLPHTPAPGWLLKLNLPGSRAPEKVRSVAWVSLGSDEVGKARGSRRNPPSLVSS